MQIRKLPPPPPPQPKTPKDTEWGAFCWFVFREACCGGGNAKALHADLYKGDITGLKDLKSIEKYRAWSADILFMELQIRRAFEILEAFNEIDTCPPKNETQLLKEFYKLLVN